MQLSPISQNTSTIGAQNLKSPSFKSVIATRIAIDGKICTQQPSVDKVFKALHKILFKKAGQNENIMRIKHRFLLNDRSFANSYIMAPHGEAIRHGVIDNAVYTFTGKSSKSLNEIGRAIGKKECTGKVYFDKMKEILAQKNMFPRLKNHHGDELIMLISAQEKKTSKGSVINISDINFVPRRRPVSISPNLPTSKVQNLGRSEQKALQTDLFDNIP